ncbi:CDP-alcohol phosphatidyltransferase family protein [Candidatus Woesearchaeota archaeon]|nr:CDP-alcohol phosphatidyltransferase family protein [Candidatus Woesearchaeota archaeon]
MYNFTSEIIQDFRGYRTKKLSSLAKFLLKLKISANVMTTLSLLFGLTSIYFLFNNHLLFIIFAILHLLADILDGVLARSSKSTAFGQYYDYSVDQIIAVLLIIKIGVYLNEYYAYIAAFLYLLTHFIYIINKFKSPILFARTFTVVILFFNLPTLAFLTAGVISVYSLALQLQYFVTKKNN